jgi:murein L,D-transpeptidase YafK
VERPSPLRVLLLAALVLASPDARAGAFARRQKAFPRVARAFEAKESWVESRFREAGAAWPPRGLFLRAFKDERELEVWAPVTSKRWTRVWTTPLCRTSGTLGPKRRQGDGQMPEGSYRIDRFNPRSSFHLSLGLDYPNATDRARSRALGVPPGSDIFVHGGCATIGCLPLRDGPMEALYVAAVLARDRSPRPLRADVFPCRFDDEGCRRKLDRAAEEDPALAPFWAGLEETFRAFEATRVPASGPEPGA